MYNKCLLFSAYWSNAEAETTKNSKETNKTTVYNDTLLAYFTVWCMGASWQGIVIHQLYTKYVHTYLVVSMIKYNVRQIIDTSIVNFG